jgi:hypothetical protein
MTRKPIRFPNGEHPTLVPTDSSDVADERPIKVLVGLLMVAALWIGATVIWGLQGLIGVALILVPVMGLVILAITRAP